MFTIYINGYEPYIEIGTDHMSYEDVLNMIRRITGDYYPDICSITFANGPLEQTDGILIPGRSVMLFDGMRFSVYDTSNA